MKAAMIAAALPGRWPVLWMLVAVRVAMGYQFQAAAGAEPWLISDFGIDYATVGSLIGFYTLPGILLALPGGFIARRVGEKNLLIFGMALMAAGGAISGIADNFGWVFTGRMVSAFGVVFLFVVMTKAVGDWFAGGERFFAMALFLNGWPLGIGAGLVVQPFIGTGLGWHWIFLTSAILTGAALLCMLVWFRHPPGYHAEMATAAPARLSRRAIVLVSVAGIGWSVVNAGHISIVSFASSFLTTRGFSAIEAGTLTSFNMWAMVTGVTLGGWITGRFSKPIAFTCVTALMGAASGVFLAFDSHYTLWMICSGLFVVMGAGVQAALPLEALGTGNRALGLGLFYAWWFFGFALLPWGAGWTRDLTGDPRAPILFGAALIALTPPFLLLFRFLQRRWSGN